MKLSYLKIEGFRKHLCTDIYFSDSTFLIGGNNIGKSSVLKAIDYLLRDEKKISEEEFLHYRDEFGQSIRLADEIVLTAEFREVPDEALTWRGFKGRVIRDANGLKIVYRKTFRPNANYVVELKEYKKNKKECFKQCNLFKDYISFGLNKEVLEEVVGKFDEEKKPSKQQLIKIEELDELYDFDEESEEWVKNPGGIPGVVLCKLPKFLLIPAHDKSDELNGKSGALVATMNELFAEVRDQSDNYQKAQLYLNKLAKELDPSDENSEFGIMMKELNTTMENVFPKAGIIASTILSEADDAIKPKFDISMFSNVNTSVELQGTGMIRSAVFGLLRYKSKRDQRKEANGTYVRPIIIGFEEPEIYLHPNAAMQMRDTIYNLAMTKNNQIICTTHSPYMIDLSKKPNQILNSLNEDCKNINSRIINTIENIPFNITKAFLELSGEDKEYIKMLLKIDDYVSKAFFVKNVLIVEGDTEEIVIRETISRLPELEKKEILCNWQLIKARGKAAIIPLVKYLKAMGISPYVIHDKDSGVSRAEMFNEPIRLVVGDDNKRWALENCMEDVLGYGAPSYDKPHKAYKYITENWSDDWLSISESWRNIIEKVWGIEDFYYNKYAEPEKMIAATLKQK